VSVYKRLHLPLVFKSRPRPRPSLEVRTLPRNREDDLSFGSSSPSRITSTSVSPRSARVRPSSRNWRYTPTLFQSKGHRNIGRTPFERYVPSCHKFKAQRMQSIHPSKKINEMDGYRGKHQNARRVIFLKMCPTIQTSGGRTRRNPNPERMTEPSHDPLHIGSARE
jgi:hypothetical protein